MKLVYACLILLMGCGGAPGTTADMAGQGSNASDQAATDSNGMAFETTSAGATGTTTSGTTTSATRSKADNDPAAKSDDSANASNAKKHSKKAGAVDKKMDATRPGTEHDMRGGNDSGAAAGTTGASGTAQ